MAKFCLKLETFRHAIRNFKSIFPSKICSQQAFDPNSKQKEALYDPYVQIEKANLIIMMNVLFAIYCFVDSGTDYKKYRYHTLLAC